MLSYEESERANRAYAAFQDQYNQQLPPLLNPEPLL